MIKRLIDWLAGRESGTEPVERPASVKVRGNIFLGRDLDTPKPDSLKVVHWVDSRDSGSDATTDPR
jgi:hypothetical protein